MTKLHELLAAEKTAINQRDLITKDTENKFAKGEQYFSGFTKRLKLIGDAPENEDIERAAAQEKALPTTVVATLDYFFKIWAKTEDLLFQKNLTNTRALASIEFRGATLAENVPVDELMGLESRLESLRKMLTQTPTLDASKEWEQDLQAAQAGTWKTVHDIVTTKTEKTMTPIVLYPATEKHPAQIEKMSTDKVIGTFTTQTISGAVTAIQKANALSVLDELLIEVKKARTRANSVDVVTAKIGDKIAALVMDAIKDAPENNQV
jgi:predicted transcriptional regulator